MRAASDDPQPSRAERSPCDARAQRGGRRSPRTLCRVEPDYDGFVLVPNNAKDVMVEITDRFEDWYADVDRKRKLTFRFPLPERLDHSTEYGHSVTIPRRKIYEELRARGVFN